MGGIGGGLDSLFGGGSNSASGFHAQAAPIVNPVTTDQLHAADQNTNAGIEQQKQLAMQLQNQNGMANQTNVFGQQQQLANALQQQAMGNGPNPAQAQLAQQTSNNINQQSAMMAGQRGAGQNAGMIARQAGQQGGALQQNAVGQAATLQAQQQLAAQQQLGQQQAQMQAVAGNQIGNQMSGAGAFTNAALQNQGQLLGAQGGYNSALVGSTASQNSANAGLASQNAKGSQGMLGGMMNGLGGMGMNMLSGSGGGDAGGGAADEFGSNTADEAFGDEAGSGLESIGEEALNKGGMVDQSSSHMKHLSDIYHPKMANGGPIKNPMESIGSPVIDSIGNIGGYSHDDTSFLTSGLDQFANKVGPTIARIIAMSQGGKVPVVVSPGEGHVPKDKAQAVAAGKMPLQQAVKKIPGKAEVKGDSLKNDTVPQKYNEGDVVIPRSVMNSDDPVKAGTKFLVDALKKSGKHGQEESDFKRALKGAIESRSKK